jgi:hypothetical protein
MCPVFSFGSFRRLCCFTHKKVPELWYFRLYIRLLLKLDFEKSTSTSCIQVTSLFTKSNNLLENSLSF